MRYPVVLMDVGGTLIGPRDTFGETYAQVFAGFGLDCDGERFDAAIRTTWREMNRRIPVGTDRYAHFEDGETGYWLRFVRRAVERATGEPIGERPAAAALRDLRARFESAAAWRIFDDVVPVLETLRRRGVRLAAVSNWDSRLPGLLERLRLDGWFETVVVSCFEGVEKPDSAIFERALERLDGRPAEALHVGDSPELDGLGARAAGVDWIWVDRHDASNPEAIRDFGGLPEIVERGLQGRN